MRFGLAFGSLLLVLVDCGAKQDLVIGDVQPVGNAGTPSGNAGTAGEATGGLATAGTPSNVAGGGAAGAAGETPVLGGVGGTDNGECTADELLLPAGALLHRYSFDGSGNLATDSVSGADGDLIGTTLDGSGSLTMDGKSRKYVDLPNGIVSSLSSLTVVTWVTWSGGAAYQRIFDFGINSTGEGLGDLGKSYIALMPSTGFEDQTKPGLGAEIKSPGFPTVTLASAENMEGRYAQVALVLESGVRASLYFDGTLLASEPTTLQLSDIDDRNDWIGQSQYQDNPFFHGTLEELRIYDAALTPCQIHTVLVRGAGML